MEPLDMDCVRGMLILIEQETYVKFSGRSVTMKMKHLYPMLDQYDSIQKFEAAKYIFGKNLVEYDKKNLPNGPRFYVCTGLSPLGHDFLRAVRDDSVWKSMKSSGKSLASMTVNKLIELAVQTVSIAVFKSGV